MASGTLEQRVSTLEKELTEVKERLSDRQPAGRAPWWEQRFGAFAGSKEYEEAVRLGREYRDSQRPEDNGDAGA